MAAAEPTKKKKVKPPKGFAQLPEWWMEITPHNTLDREEDVAKRQHDNQEARMYRNLAVQSDWEQANGENSNYSLGENGELIDKKTGKPVETGGDSGYTREEKSGEWLKDGKPIFGRQFNAGGESPSSYGHQDMNWKKPDWMKVKLKATGTGDAMRKGGIIGKNNNNS